MGEVVNLRLVRKRSAQEAERRAADENRVAHGLSKAGKLLAKTRRARAAAGLEAHRRENGAGQPLEE